MPPKRPAQDQAEATKKGRSGRKKLATGGSDAGSTNDPRGALVTKLVQSDVLMGRGALATDYEGNLRLRELVRHRQDEYIRTAKRNRKHQIAEEIVHLVRSRGGRFLQAAETVEGIDPRILPKHEAAWFIVEDMTIITSKVKQLLRDVKPKADDITTQQEAKLPPQEVSVSTASIPEASQLVRHPSTTSSSIPSHGPPTMQPMNGVQSLFGSHSAASSLPSHQGILSAAPTTQVNHSGQGQAQGPHQHASVSLATANPGQDNASTVLHALLVDYASRGQQPDALLALTVASRLLPGRNNESPSVAPPRSAQAPVPPTPSAGQYMTQVITTILEQNQQRSRERAMTNELLARMINPERQAPSTLAPAPTSTGMSEEAMTALLEHFRSQGSRAAGTALGAPAAAPPPAPTLPQSNLPSQAPDLATLLRGVLGQPTSGPQAQEQSLPGQSSLAGPGPSVMAELERLLPAQYRQAQPAPPQGQDAGDPHRGLQELLRSLQARQFPPPS